MHGVLDVMTASIVREHDGQSCPMHAVSDAMAMYIVDEHYGHRTRCTRYRTR
jgi:hypothetical protein